DPADPEVKDWADPSPPIPIDRQTQSPRLHSSPLLQRLRDPYLHRIQLAIAALPHGSLSREMLGTRCALASEWRPALAAKSHFLLEDPLAPIHRRKSFQRRHVPQSRRSCARWRDSTAKWHFDSS